MSDSIHDGTKLCQCKNCVRTRYNAWLDKRAEFMRENKVAPKNPAQTVMVKTYEVHAHWRRNPHHMNADEALKELVQALQRAKVKAP